MIEYKSDGLVVFVTSVGGGGSGEGGGSGGQMHPASLEKLITREDELEAENSRLREALRNIASKNPFHNQCPPINDVQFYSQMIVEMVGIANAALKEKE